MAGLLLQAAVNLSKAAYNNTETVDFILSITNANGEAYSGALMADFKLVTPITSNGNSLQIKRVSFGKGFYFMEIGSPAVWQRGSYIALLSIVKGTDKGQCLVAFHID